MTSLSRHIASQVLSHVRGVVCAAFIVLFLVSAAGVSHAAVTLEQLPDANDHGDFVVGPGKQEVTLAPGQSQVIDLTIANRLGTEKTFTIQEEDFSGSDDPDQTVVLLGDDRGPYSLKDYISAATTSIEIPNGYRARIPVTISIPADSQPGGLYGSLVVGTVSNPAQTDSADGAAPTNAVISQIGTLFFVTVPGPTVESGQLSGFSLAGGHSVIFEPQSISFDLLFKNTGDMYLDPSGSITVTNMLGAPIENISVDPWFAMPQSLRFREVVWNTPFLFGRYVAHASVSRGYGSTTDEANLVFWVIPWKVILAILAGLIIVIGGIKLIVSWASSRFTISRR